MIAYLTDEEKAGMTVQETQVSPSILSLTRMKSQYIGDTDAFDKCVGTSYIKNIQTDRRKQFLIGQDLERKPNVRTIRPRAKCLSFVWPLFLLRPHQEGSRLTVCTDYSTRQYVFNVGDGTGKLAQCRLR